MRERERERFLHLNSQQPLSSACGFWLSCFYQCTSGSCDPIGSEEINLANQNILVQTDEHNHSLSDDSDQNSNGSKDSRNIKEKYNHIFTDVTCEPCWPTLTEWLIKSCWTEVTWHTYTEMDGAKSVFVGQVRPKLWRPNVTRHLKPKVIY